MAALWQRQGLPVRGPPQAQLDAANIEWMNASCDPVQLEGTAAASGEEEEEEEGPGVGGEVDDEVDEDDAERPDVARLRAERLEVVVNPNAFCR